MAKETYQADVDFLARRAGVVELSGPGEARVAVTPEYQGRVMTSCLAGPGGASFGWINKAFLAAGRQDETFNNYGGEDRFWLGPEAGQFALFFRKGEPFDLKHWRTPAGFNSGAFRAASRDASSIVMTARFDVTNYSGTTFSCSVRRMVRVLDRAALSTCLGSPLPEGVRMVAFETVNVLTNAGKDAWTRQGGLPSLWSLGMFKPLPRGRVIVPFLPGDEEALGAKATTDYFGPLPAERCRVSGDHLLFSCDGLFRSKIGISPRRARDVLGSYDGDAKVLTIAQFSLPDGAARKPYVNSLWKIQDQPFAGDVVNSYNDGEEKPGAGQLGPFYELETSSPAAELAPGASITHVHRTCHLAGDFDALSGVAKAVLGVDLGEVG